MNFDVAASRRRCLAYRRRLLDISRPVMADTFSLQDAVTHSHGSHSELLAAHGLDLDTIAPKVGLR